MVALGARARALPAEARGALLYVLAVFFLVSMDALSKELSQRYDTMLVIWARYVGQAAIVALLAAPWLRTLLRTRYPGLQLARSSFMFAATICGFFAFALMPLADATAIFETAPLMVTALAALILGERVGPRRWTAVAVGFVGALVIVRPGGAAFTPAALLPLGAAAFYAGFAIVTRYVGRDESPWTAFLYAGLVGTVVSSVYAPFVWETPTRADAALMLLMGASGAAGQFLLILALRLAEASALAPLSYVGLVFAALYGLALFGDFPDFWTIVGAAVIVGSGLYVWRREAALRGR